jgi:hypothetical protein
MLSIKLMSLIVWFSLDPVQVTQMAKYLETVYVSGWQSSSTASTTHEPGPDLAGKLLIYILRACHIAINCRLSLKHRP